MNTDMGSMPIPDLIAAVREHCENSDDIAKVLILNVFCNRLQEQQNLIQAVRKAVVRYHKAQGCGCCSDYYERVKAEEELGELLGFDAYNDGSGYNLHDLPGESNDNN